MHLFWIIELRQFNLVDGAEMHHGGFTKLHTDIVKKRKLTNFRVYHSM